ncbi:MAG: hypothetical protein AAFP93_02810 [Bacteroidota bacterium]
MKTLAEVRKAINFSHSGTLSNLVDHLIISGFVKKQSLWSFKTNKPLKQSLYRLCDPYMRFYLKFIEPQRNKIDLGNFQDTTFSHMPGIDVHLGLQMEQLLLQNRSLLLKAIGIPPDDIIADGPFRQSKTTKQRGCQIDYLIQTSTNSLIACEFKFSRRELGTEIIEQVQEKVRALKIPRGFGTVPVLCHIGGVSTSVAAGRHFYRIIDITDFLEMNNA